MLKEIFTTQEVAEFCKVDQSTITNWIDDEKLPAYKTVGGHRRIKREDIVPFLTKHGMPIPPQLKREKLRVLICDDEKNIVDIITRILKKRRWKLIIEPAYNGYEVGAKLTDFFPDLVILDIYLPGIDGYQVLKDIKANEKLEDVKILAISGKNIPETRQKILSCGANEFLAKPFDIKEIVSAVARLLELPEKRIGE